MWMLFFELVFVGVAIVAAYQAGHAAGCLEGFVAGFNYKRRTSTSDSAPSSTSKKSELQ
jgi:hypothetical protein